MKSLPGKYLFPIPLLAMVLAISLVMPDSVSAQLQETAGFSQFDLDGDGDPDRGLIESSWATGRDQILVFDGAGDMNPAEDWQAGTDTDNDTWIFDVGADGSADLILVFTNDGGGNIARFYDDTNGDGAVAYHVAGTQVIIDESAYWSLEMTAESGWYTSAGHPNMNVKALLDKPTLDFQFMTEDVAERYMLHDGFPDVAFELRDSDRDGVPEYYLVRLLSYIPLGYGVGRSKLYYNAIGSEPVSPSSAFFWPFLALQPSNGSGALRYFDVVPLVSVDWETSEIRGIMWEGYPIGGGYHINGTQYINMGQINETTFEVPHAYYDLAGNRDAFPELNIRLFRDLENPWQEIRYSWNQFNAGTLIWDFKLGLMSDHPIEEVVEFDDFGLRMIPYRRLPYWATEREWKLTTFVAREGGRRASSEGIYAWTPWAGADPVSSGNPSVEAFQASDAYLSGTADVPPYEYFVDIWDGYRGEYKLVRASQPILYFSPVDGRLHLHGAERGIGNLGQGRYVVYGNTDGDEYIDQWLYLESGKVRRQLHFAGTHMLVAADNAVVLKRVNMTSSLFETLPPRDHGDWLALGEQLEAHQAGLAPDDFRAMASRFEGQEWQVDGADMRGFRLNGPGFRFVLELQPGFSVTGSDGPSLDSLPPGEYVVSYTDRFEVLPLTPARIEVVPGTFRLSETSPVAREFLWIEAELRNVGLEDAPEVWIQAFADGSRGDSDLVTEKEIELLAGRSVALRFDWAPRGPGRWRINLDWGLGALDQHPEDATGQVATLNAQVEPSQPLSVLQVWQISNQREPLVLLGLLLAVALAAAGTLVLSLRAVGSR